MEFSFNYFLFLDVLVLLILVFGLLVGLIRGFKKSLRRFIALLIPTILLFIFLNPITNKVMSTEINLSKIDEIIEVIPDEYTKENYSMDKAISVVIGSYVYPNDAALQENSEVQKLALSMSSMIVKIVIYFSLLPAVWFISIIIRIILRIICGKPKKSGRLIGMGLGFAQSIVIFILLFLPIFGTLSLTSSVVHDVSTYVNESEIDEIVEYTDMYENTITKKYVFNFLTKVLCTNKSLSCDAQYVASAFSFKLNDKKVNLNKEYLDIKEALPSIMKLINVIEKLDSDENKVIKLSEFTDEDIENISSILRNSNLIRVLIPSVIEYSVYSMNEESSDYSNLLQELQNTNWDKELKSIADLINILKDHNDLEINVGNLEYVIKSNGVIDLVEDFVTGALQIDIITDIIIPLGIDMLEEQFTTGEFANYEIDFTEISNINWKTDGASFVTTILSIYKEYLKTDINFSDLKVPLNNKDLPEFINVTFDEIKNSNIITDTLLPVVIEVLIANIEKNESITQLEIDFTLLKNVNWKDNIDSIKVLLHDLVISYQTLDINPEEFNLVLKNNKLQNELNIAVNNILECEVFAEYILPIVMDAVVKNLENNETLQSFDFDFAAIRNTNWKTELNAVKNVFIKFLNAYQNLDYNKDEWTKIFENEKLSEYISDIYQETKKSTLVKEHILPKLPNKIQELLDNANTSINISFLKEIITEENIDILLTSDLDNLITLFKEINKLGLFADQELNLEDENIQNSLINVIKKVFKLNVVKGIEKNIVESILNIFDIESILNEFNITLEYDNVTNWENEVDILCSLFKNILKLKSDNNSFDISGLFTKELTEDEKNTVAGIVSSIGNSKLFNDSIYIILNDVVKQIDSSCELSLTNEEKNIVENINGFEYETLHILNLKEKLENINFDDEYSNLDPELIKEIMLYSSEAVLSTKILGTILNKVFDGDIDIDFTNQDTMKDSVDVVYNTIKIATMINDSTIDLNDSFVVNELISSIENIAKNEENLELTNMILNNIIGNETPVSYTLDEIDDAANVVEEIIEIYQNATNQDDFNLDNLSEETKEKIENSDIAKAILEALFK